MSLLLILKKLHTLFWGFPLFSWNKQKLSGGGLDIQTWIENVSLVILISNFGWQM